MTKSEDWDNMGRKLPFGIKVLIGVGVLVLLITFAIAFTTQPIFAYVEECHYNDMVGIQVKLLCYVIMIHGQNEVIIEKLDWNNCAISHIDRDGYTWKHVPFSSPIDNNANNYEQLVYLCGDMP